MPKLINQGTQMRYYDFIEYVTHENIYGACELFFGDENVSKAGTWRRKD